MYNPMKPIPYKPNEPSKEAMAAARELQLCDFSGKEQVIIATARIIDTHFAPLIAQRDEYKADHEYDRRNITRLLDERDAAFSKRDMARMELEELKKQIASVEAERDKYQDILLRETNLKESLRADLAVAKEKNEETDYSHWSPFSVQAPGVIPNKFKGGDDNALHGRSANREDQPVIPSNPALRASLTPRTDALAKQIGSLACQWRTGAIDAVQFEEAAQEEFDKLRLIERNNITLQSENARLRGALQYIGTTAHCISLSGPATTPTLQDAWSKFDRISVMCTSALQPKSGVNQP